MRSWFVALAAAVLALAVPRVQAADFCSTCELQLGIGASYDYWNYTHGLVVPLAFNFDDDRWELAVFRFVKSQDDYSPTFKAHILWATPYWATSFSRRVELLRFEHVKVFAGLGGSYKTQENRQVGSLWNFSESFGVRFIPQPGYSIELVGRHFSNAGLKLPNHGQDFVTLMFSVYPALF